MKTYDELREQAKKNEVEAARDRLNLAHASYDALVYDLKLPPDDPEVVQAYAYLRAVEDERFRLRRVYGF